MLPRIYRLPAHTRLVKSTQYTSAYYTLRIAKNDGQPSRFGFIMSKKVAKSAIIRNSSRRKLRTGIEIVLERIIPGYDFLFIMNKNLTGIATEILQKDIEQLLVQKGYLQ